MEQVLSQQPIQESLQTYNAFQTQMNRTVHEMQNYLEFAKHQQFQRNENETNDQSLRRAETTLDRFSEIISLKTIIRRNYREALQLIDQLKNQFETALESCGTEEMDYEIHDNAIEEIIDIRRRMMEERIAVNAEHEEEYRNEFEHHREELMRMMRNPNN